MCQAYIDEIECWHVVVENMITGWCSPLVRGSYGEWCLLDGLTKHFSFTSRKGTYSVCDVNNAIDLFDTEPGIEPMTCAFSNAHRSHKATTGDVRQADSISVYWSTNTAFDAKLYWMQPSYPGHYSILMITEDFYGGRTGPLQCEVQRMRSWLINSAIIWCTAALQWSQQ